MRPTAPTTATAVLLLLAAGCAATPAVPAATDDRLTLAKFNALQKGMSKAECDRVIGRVGVAREPTFGRDDTGRAVVEVDDFDWADSRQVFIWAAFVDGNLNDKMQVGLLQ